MFYTYMIRCADNSIYTGITTDLKRRFEEHTSKDKKAAKYTKLHQAQKIELAWQSETLVLASKLEYHIKKRLTKKQKEDLIQNYKLLKKFSLNKIESTNYTKVRKNVINKINKTIVNF